MDGIRVDTRPGTLDVVFLKAKLYDSHCENQQLREQLEQTKRELEEARALLDEVVASATAEKRIEPFRTGIVNQDPPVSEGLHFRDRVQTKRPRSPSLEYVDLPVIQKSSTSKIDPHEIGDSTLDLQVLPTQALPAQVEIVDLTKLEEAIVPKDMKPKHTSEDKPKKHVGQACYAKKGQSNMVKPHDQHGTKRRKAEDNLEPTAEEALPQASCVTREAKTRDTAASSNEIHNSRQLRSSSRRLVTIRDANDSIKARPHFQNVESEHNKRYTQPQDSVRVTRLVNVAEDIAIRSSSLFEAGPSRKPEVRAVGPLCAKAFNLPAEDVQQYLSDVPSFRIQPEPVPVYVPRVFLRVSYGGSDQSFLQNIAAERNPSGPLHRRLVFPTLDLNPAMPSVPGAPGLVFASRHEILQDAPWTVFCKKSNASPVVWLYVGEYENTLMGKMTKEQFAAQAKSVQREWARSLLKCKRFDVYVAMRARVALRVAGLLPLPDGSAQMDDQDGAQRTEEEAKLVQEEICAVKRDQGLPVSVEDLVAAFVNGEEGIDIIRMKCVGYDHVFAADMKERLRSYPKPVSRQKT